MTKADNYLVGTIKVILANGYKDENPRPKYADGTPAYTYSINHVTRQYDLSAGEFPICTLRPIAWKTGIREIFTIYQKPFLPSISVFLCIVSHCYFFYVYLHTIVILDK